jgi:multidrug efflux pump subunit AcrB
MEFSSNMFSLVAMVFAIGIVGAVAVDISAILQKVEAKGCNNEIAINASRTRCIH